MIIYQFLALQLYNFNLKATQISLKQGIYRKKMDKSIAVYDFETLIRFRAIKFKQSIEYGKVIHHILSKINHKLLESSVQKLKHKYNSKDKFQNNLIHKYGLNEQKKQYLVNVLQEIKKKCYNFQQKHIEQIQKFNDYYFPNQRIQLPEQLKLQKCSRCLHNNMFSKASLQFHIKNCQLNKKLIAHQMRNQTGEHQRQNDSHETQFKEQTTKQNELLSDQEFNQQLYNKQRQAKTKEIKKKSQNKNISKKQNKRTPNNFIKSQHQQQKHKKANLQIDQQSLQNAQYNEIQQQIYYNDQSQPFRDELFDCLQLYEQGLKDKKLRICKQQSKRNTGQKNH